MSTFEKTVNHAEAIIRSGKTPSATKKGSGIKHCSGLSKKVKEVVTTTRLFQ